MNPAVGIDLGTTNTVVGIQTDPMGPVVLDVDQPVDDRKHLDKLPQIKSAVFFESKDSASVGYWAAVNRYDSFRSIKSHMGTRWRANHPFTGELIKPAYINAHVVKLAYSTLINKFPEWDRTALITVPASFNTDQRNDTIEAANIAGFKNIKLLDEPTAAFYYFFNQQRDFREYKNILVFDFGGGTLDVSIINVEQSNDDFHLDTIGRSRYNNLGGDDIDLELATFMLGCWEFSSDNELARLSEGLKRELFRLFIKKSRLFKEEAEDYLRQELEIPEFNIQETIYGADAGEEMTVTFNRTLTLSQYQDVMGKYLQHKNELNIYRPIEEAFAVAKQIRPGFSKDALDLILYTGGASNMQGVQSALKAYFRNKPCVSISEEDACDTVALGAACCRYDELNRHRNVVMTNRLLESIFTREPGNQQYIEIIPLTCQPSDDYKKVNHNFKLTRPAIKIRFPLFRGVSAHDHQLVPMRDIEIDFDRILGSDTRYEVYYKMTMNKTIELKFIFLSDGGRVEKTTFLDVETRDRTNREDVELCKINLM